MVKKIVHAPLHWQIISAMVIGGLTSWTLKNGFAVHSGWFVNGSEALGALFMRLLRMVIVPLVTSSIIVGVAGAGDPKNLGRMGIKTFLYYMMTSILGIMVGLTLSGLIRPGVGVALDLTETIPQERLETPGSPMDVLTRMIPINPIQAMVEGDMLAIIFFSILVGAAMTRVSSDFRNRVLPVIDGFFHIMMKLTTGVIRLAPIGVYGLIFRAVMEFDNWEMAGAIAKYMVTIGLGLSIHLFLVLPLVIYLFTRLNPLTQFRHMTDALLTAFSTSSSSATLPVTIECVEINAGVSNRISSFVLPLGATVNMDGTALYECAGVLFIAQVMGIDLNMGQQMMVVLTALLASIGAAGVPSAGLVMIFIVLDAVGIQGELVGIIVGTMLAVDRPLDMCGAVVNIFSDSVGTVIIARSEGELDEERW